MLKFVVLLALAFVAVSARPQFLQSQGQARTIQNDQSTDPHTGAKIINIVTENGIRTKETWTPITLANGDVVFEREGTVQYNAPDGTPSSRSWRAGLYGILFAGNDLPNQPQ